MIRLLILCFTVLGAGAFIGALMKQDPGYVLISVNNTTIETSFWTFVFLGFLIFLTAHWSLNLFFRIGLPGKHIGEWRRNRIARTAQKRTFKGLVALSEGHWWQAQRLLSQTAPTAAQPLINYLGAAKAAHEQGLKDNADAFFAQARAIAPEAEVSIGLQEAEVQIDRGDILEATGTLKRLHILAPKHSRILRELSELYRRQQEWQGLIELMPKLHKFKVFESQQLSELEALCYREMLLSVVTMLPVESTEETRVKALSRGWKALPNKLNQSVEMMHTYAVALIEAKAFDKAEVFLKEQIKRTWDDSLISLYGTVPSSDSLRHYKQAVAWLKKQPNNATLLLCTARLAMAHSEWQVAVQYFEKSIDILPSVEGYRDLAKLLESLGEQEKSLLMSQRALALTEDSNSAIPLPLPTAEHQQAAEPIEPELSAAAKA